MSALIACTTGGSEMRATRPNIAFSVNHMFPSGPGAMNHGAESSVRPSVYSSTSPSVSIRPMRPGLGLGEPDRAVRAGGDAPGASPA